MPKRWNENSFTGVSLLLVKYHGWRLISYDNVGAEQMPRTLNAYQKDLLSEYHNRLFKCFESAQRTNDAELYVFLSKRRMEYPENLTQRFIFYP